MSDNLINAYLEYLRNISRKIISKSGFENVLPDITKKRNPHYLNIDKENIDIFNNECVITPNDKVFKYLRNINSYLEVETDFRLFVGSGLVNGYLKGKKRNYYVCAPLFYALVEYEYENKKFNLSVDEDSVTINHDLLTRIFDIDIDDDFDEEELYNTFEFDKYRILDSIENQLIGNGFEFLSQSRSVFEKIQNEILELKNISVSSEEFDYKKYVTKKLDFSNPLFYANNFFFANKTPDQLSAYEGLNNLLKKKPIEHDLLNKLFKNTLTNNKVKINDYSEIGDSEIIKVIDENIPLSLSDNQKSAIVKAWQNDLSYIEGPPGTGKSYTIAALIISAIFLNKKILLVSHKKAAIDVVKEMIDSVMGANALFHVTPNSKEEKEKLKDYIDKLLKDAEHKPLFAKILGKSTLGELEDQIFFTEKSNKRLIEKTEDFRFKLEKILGKENTHYQLHNDFITKRNIFFKNYEIDNRKNYIWSKKPLNYNGYFKAYSKYEKIKFKKQRNRINFLYSRKFLKNIFNNFSCEKNIAIKDYNYIENLIQLNLIYTKAHFIKNEVSKNDLDLLRRNLDFTILELKTNIGNLVKHFWSFRLFSKLIGQDNIENRNQLDAFKRMLYFKKASIVQEKMESIDYNIISNILPIWCGELRDLGKSLKFQNEIFDLVIVDEASQVNIAEIIPAFYRGKKICVVGDKNQLNLNATGVGFAVSKSFEKLTWQSIMTKYSNVIDYEAAKEKCLLVTHSSILDFISSSEFSVPTTVLDEHYRSLPQLAQFTNKTFYGEKWKIMTENGENMKKNCFSNFIVGGVRDTKKKLVRSEINKIKELLQEIKISGFLNEIKFLEELFKGKPYTIGILSFLTQQVNEIRDLVDDNFEDLKKLHNIFVATPEEFQGNERDVMIISLGLDGTSSWGKGFYENNNRFNVATSRAKYFTYLIYGKIPENTSLIADYLKEYGVNVKQPEIKVEPQYKKWCFDESKLESEFEFKVYEYLKKYQECNSNVELFNQVTACGQKRLDFVLFNKDNKVTCAIEVDGKDHFIDGTLKYTEAHLSRMAILKRAGWKIINLKYYNWWENGWICNDSVPYFNEEIKKLYSKLDKFLLLQV
jgi:hypothetical protein